MKRARRRKQVHLRHRGRRNREGEQRVRMATRAGIRKIVRDVRRTMGQPTCPAWWILLVMGGAGTLAFELGLRGAPAPAIAQAPRLVDQPPELRADLEAGFGKRRPIPEPHVLRPTMDRIMLAAPGSGRKDIIVPGRLR